MQSDNTRKKAHVFWIEWGAAFAAVTLLAIVILPITTRAGDFSVPTRSETCRDHMKSLMLGIRQYVQDYDEIYPPLTYRDKRTSWRQSIKPYIKNDVLFICPINPARATSPWSDSSMPDGGTLSISYGANSNVMKIDTLYLSRQFLRPKQL